MNMHKYLINFFVTLSLFILPIAAIVFVVNLWIGIQVENLGKSMTSKPILLKDKNIIWNSLDYRILKKSGIVHLDKSIDVLALGSSKMMRVDTLTIDGGTFFNAWVSAARLEDTIGLFEKYRTSHGYPKTVVLGVDAYFFNPIDHEKLWSYFSKPVLFYVLRFYKNKKIFSLNVMQYCKQLFLDGTLSFFDPKVFRFSSRALSRSVIYKKSLNPFIPDSQLDFQSVERFETDGSTHKGIKMHHMTIEELERQALEKFGSGYDQNVMNDGYEMYPQINSEKIALFEYFISDLRKHHVQVKLILMPYYPKAYRLMIRRENDQTKYVENYIRKFSKDNNLNVFGSYDISKTRCFSSEFEDVVHPSAECVEKIFKSYR